MPGIWTEKKGDRFPGRPLRRNISQLSKSGLGGERGNRARSRTGASVDRSLAVQVRTQAQSAQVLRAGRGHRDGVNRLHRLQRDVARGLEASGATEGDHTTTRAIDVDVATRGDERGTERLRTREDVRVTGLSDVHDLADKLQRAEADARLVDVNRAVGRLEEGVTTDAERTGVGYAAESRASNQVARGRGRDARGTEDESGRVAAENRQGHVLSVEHDTGRAEEVRGRVVDGDVTIGGAQGHDAATGASGVAAELGAREARVDDVTVQAGRRDGAVAAGRHDNLTEVQGVRLDDGDVLIDAGDVHRNGAEVVGRVREGDAIDGGERCQTEDVQRAALRDRVTGHGEGVGRCRAEHNIAGAKQLDGTGGRGANCGEVTRGRAGGVRRVTELDAAARSREGQEATRVDDDVGRGVFDDAAKAARDGRRGVGRNEAEFGGRIFRVGDAAAGAREAGITTRREIYTTGTVAVVRHGDIAEEGREVRLILDMNAATSELGDVTRLAAIHIRKAADDNAVPSGREERPSVKVAEEKIPRIGEARGNQVTRTGGGEEVTRGVTADGEIAH